MMNSIMTTERAQAIGQSRLVKNSVHSTLPNVIVSAFPSGSGITNSQADIVKTIMHPLIAPDFDSGTLNPSYHPK
ncbi:MAG: hypothetical protein LBJ69_01325 [Holosporales bacterium]|jgi:hypothetical protein|nr:hypothetical protein [Holosporales bacterium]